MPPPVLGIDFGTTNTVVAVVLEEDNVEVLCNDIGSRLTPSVVYIDPSDPTKHQVGEAALRLGVGDPQNTIRNVKRILGYPPETARFVIDLGPVKFGTSDYGDGVLLNLNDGSKITPEEVVAMQLVEVRKTAKRYLYLDQEVLEAVITVPSYYTAAQRRAIRDAAYLADLQVVSLVNETTAAAAVYAHERQDSKTALIVDVGGGGCCISVVRVAADEVTVLACSTRQPGGVTFDNQMLNYLKKAIKEQHGKDVNDHRTNEILHSQWTAAKIKLSRVPHAIIQTFLPEIEAEFSMTLTRTVFEKECEELFKTIVKSIHRTLKKAEVEVNLLEDVVLVGGCTRIPKLRELIQDAIGLKVHKALSADEVVAQGAALLGARIVKINQEVLGLNTNFQVLSSEKQDYPETVWSIGTRLPLTISFDCLKEKDNTDIMVKQGHDMKHLIFVCELPVCKFQNFRIDLEGCFLFGTGSPNKVFASKYLKGCIPQAYLKTLKQKLQSQEKSSLLFAQAKNALEDVLRKGRSMVTNEEDLFPEEHLKFREECCKKLKWLNENASAAIETFEKTRDMMEQLRESLHEKCERERQRIRERTALKDILDKAVDMEVFDDEFKERTRELKDDWGKEKEWLAKNSEASVNEYLTKKECVLQAMKILKDDRDKAAIIKRTNALRESFLKKITELQTYADRRSNGDDLDRKCGNNLTQIWNSAIMWLKSNPTPSEVELEQKIEKFEKDRISTEETFEKLKKQEQIKREDAFKTAERHILKGLNLKVSDFEIVHEAALMFVKTCDKDLIWLRNNPDRNATEYSELTTKVEIDFRNLQNLHEVEKRRLQTKARFKQSLQNALKQTEEPFSIFFKNCLVWLEDHPRAEEKLLKTSLSLVESALDELKKYSYHTNTARTAKGLALEKTESLSQKLGLQFNDSAATAEIRREDNGYKPAEYEEQSPSTLGDRNGLINHANGSPSVAIHYHPTLTERAEQLAVEALSGADKAGSMALLLSKVIFGGREFVSLAVRYVEESGQPVERPLLLKEPMGFGEDTESVKELFVEPFLALCKKAQIDWNKNLLGISHVGLGVQSEVLAKFLAGMRCGLVEDLDCGAVRLDERFVQKILRQAGCCRLESPLHSLRDFFLSIGSLRRLFCTGGKWCKVLEDKCCSPCAGTNPWHTYTSTISFVSVEQKGLYLALTAVAQKDPDLRIHVEAIQGKMEDSSFKICLETCKEFFKLIPGFDDKLALSNSNSITDLNKSLLKAFKYPEGSLEPFFNLPLYSDKLRANKLFEMCEDLMKPVLEEWKKSWDVLLSLLTAICDVLPEGNGKETPARCTRSQGKLAKDLQNFKSQFPERLTSLPAMLCGLPRKMFAKEYPDLHNSLMRALTAPLLPPQGPRAQEQLRACALHAITSPRLIDWPLPAETHP